MVIAVDIGNSAMKLVCDSDPTAIVRIKKSLDAGDYQDQLARFVDSKQLSEFNVWLVCSVDRAQTERLGGWISKNRPADRLHHLSADEIPLPSVVDDRNQLGRDRLLTAWYATTGNTVSDSASIVVDAGTAVTIDVAVNGLHQGGLIFPGTRTSLSSLESQTEALPDLATRPPPDFGKSLQLGHSTQEAILLGVHQQQYFGIVAMVNALHEQYSVSQVFCCGGALAPFVHLLPESWSYEPNYVTDAIFALSTQVLR